MFPQIPWFNQLWGTTEKGTNISQTALRTIARIGKPNPKNSKEVTLHSAWANLRSSTPEKRRELTAGVDGITMNKFSLQQDVYLRALSKQVIQSYKFGKLKAHAIPKSKSKYRIICVPTVADRIVQKSLLLYLNQKCSKYAQSNEISYGSRGVRRAVDKAKGYRKINPYIYKTDVKAFFDNVPRVKLAEQIKSKIPQKSLHEILISASKCEVKRDGGRGKARIINEAGIKKGKGVRQGMPLSPFFSNLYLADFDIEMLIQSKKLGFKVIRYVDDLIFFAKDEISCQEIHKLCKKTLDALDLEIPNLSEGDKTQIYGPKDDAEFLGIALRYCNDGSYKAIIPEVQYDKIEERIFQLGDINYLAKERISITQVLGKFKGMGRGYEQAYSMCDMKERVRLKNKTGDWYKSSKRKLFRGLGVPVDTLNDKQKSFLEL